MAKTPTRLVGPELVSDTAAPVFTAAVDTRVVVRHIHVFNGSDNPVNLTLSIGEDADGTRLYDTVEIGPRQPFERFTYQVLEAGETIEAAASTDGELTLTLNGDVIDLA